MNNADGAYRDDQFVAVKRTQDYQWDRVMRIETFVYIGLILSCAACAATLVLAFLLSRAASG